MLRVNNFLVKYDKAIALREISLRVNSNEVVAIIGPNGAGKSSLFKALSALIPWEGELFLNNNKIVEIDPIKMVKEGLIHCPERRHLFPKLNVKDNLLLGAYLRRDNKDIKKDLEDVYDLFPILKKRVGQLAKYLSGGESQMLAIGRAYMSNPVILILDEPTLGLSPLVCENISKSIENIKKRGISILIGEQNTTFAMKNAERIYLLETGQVVKEGPCDFFKGDKYIQKTYLNI